MFMGGMIGYRWLCIVGAIRINQGMLNYHTDLYKTIFWLSPIVEEYTVRRGL